VSAGAGGRRPQASGGTVLSGILLAVAASGLFAVLDAIAKHLSHIYPSPLVAWARYALHVFVMLALLGPRWGRRLVTTQHPWLQVARGACLGMSSLLFFAALARLPQAEATAIIATAPILVTAVSVRWLGERATVATWVALAASFCGVLLIVRPGSAMFGTAALLPLLAMVFIAGYTLSTRALAGRDESVATLFIGAVVATLLLSGLVPLYWTAPQSAGDLLLFVSAGAVGAFAHLLLVRAYERADATTLAPFTYTHPVAALVMGWLVFDTFPDGPALVGMAMIVATGVVMAVMRR
jgi:drug/metabolite transporter (DMT)-like permease